MSIEPEDWRPQEPPPDFADRVMARVGEETGGHGIAKRSRGSLRAGVAGGLALAAAVALTVGWHGTQPSSHGDAIASAREEVRLGGRGIAVLERGAHVTWNGDDVKQTKGDVFYRVERGGTFRVHTPSGDVQVLGTCFRVQIEDAENGEKQVKVRDLKAGTIGAALGAAAFVSVYEGKVAFSQPGRGGAAITLAAGESARADEHGLTRATPASEAREAREANGADDSLVAANANLADSVREYKRRLEAIEAQKATLDKQLATAQQRLTQSQRDGASGPSRSAYELTPDDWKQLAEEGTVRAHYPCIRRGRSDDDLSGLQKLGLPPEDGPIVAKALAASRARIWATVRPLCASALAGDVAAADRLGVATCEGIVRGAAESEGTNVAEDMRAVAEMRAGIRPIPSDGGDPVVALMLALTGESGAVQKELAGEIGAEGARQVVYGDDTPACWSNSAWTAGASPSLPPK